MLPVPPPTARLLAVWLALALLLGACLAAVQSARVTDLGLGTQVEAGPLTVMVLGHTAVVMLTVPCPAPPRSCPWCAAPSPTFWLRWLGC